LRGGERQMRVGEEPDDPGNVPGAIGFWRLVMIPSFP